MLAQLLFSALYAGNKYTIASGNLIFPLESGNYRLKFVWNYYSIRSKIFTFAFRNFYYKKLVIAFTLRFTLTIRNLLH